MIISSSSRRMSSLFACFKQFKTYAESELGVTLGTLQDDKSGEYMSKAMEEYCIDHGITRRHTVTDLSKTVLQSVSTVFSPRGLLLCCSWFSSSVLGRGSCLTCTRPEPHSDPRLTPLHMKAGSSPSPMSLISGLGLPHICACVEGQAKLTHGEMHLHWLSCRLQGLEIYKPVTKKAVISERVVFDERYFPGLKNWSSLPSNRSHPPTQPT